MTTAKHSPGPWRAENAQISLIGGHARTVNIVSNGNGVVARVYNVSQPKDEQSANVALLQAAPELLAFVSKIGTELGVMAVGGVPSIEHLRNLMREAFELSKKAEG